MVVGADNLLKVVQEGYCRYGRELTRSCCLAMKRLWKRSMAGAWVDAYGRQVRRLTPHGAQGVLAKVAGRSYRPAAGVSEQ